MTLLTSRNNAPSSRMMHAYSSQEERHARARTPNLKGTIDGESASLLEGLPDGSSNSDADGRANVSAFLRLGQLCPTGYSPGQRVPFPRLESAPWLDFIVDRPHEFPSLAARGCLDVFLSFGDVVDEASEAGIRGIEELIQLPFVQVDVVTTVRKGSGVSSIDDLLRFASTPIRCVSDYPWLARRCFYEEPRYSELFGALPPLIKRHGRTIEEGCESVHIIDASGGGEPSTGRCFYDADVTVRSSGRTIERCRLKTIKVIGSYCPGLYGRSGIQSDPVLAPRVDWIVQRLGKAFERWEEIRRQQKTFPFMRDLACTTGSACHRRE